MAQDEPSSGRVSAGLQEIDVVLGGVDDVVEVAAHDLLGQAEREALDRPERGVGGQGERVGVHDHVHHDGPVGG